MRGFNSMTTREKIEINELIKDASNIACGERDILRLGNRLFPQA